MELHLQPGLNGEMQGNSVAGSFVHAMYFPGGLDTSILPAFVEQAEYWSGVLYAKHCERLCDFHWKIGTGWFMHQ